MERARLIQRLRASGCAVERAGAFFLVDPSWSEAERRQASALMERRPAAGDPGEAGLGWLGVRTGGSGGGVKFARHDEHTLGAAVEGFRTHFGLERVNAVGLLPLTHVSGLMAAVRCDATGGRYEAFPWKRLESGEFPALRDGEAWVVSLVPTQLQRLLQSPSATDWLRRFHVIFLGGGPLWPSLAEAARTARLQVSVTYGMTETAAMVTGSRPDEFLAGDTSCGRALPHAAVTITAEGLVRIAGASIHRGYWPDAIVRPEIVTEDLGELDRDGRLRVWGRRDAMIITGGKKVAPTEVEAALRATGEFEDVCVLGLPDPEWGEAVVACYPAAGRTPDLTRAVAGLAAFQRPKRWVALAEWTRTPQGKINRVDLRAAVLRALEARGER